MVDKLWDNAYVLLAEPHGPHADSDKATPVPGHKIAYVMQTSGTTGEPKTVQVPHRCIVPNILHLRYGIQTITVRSRGCSQKQTEFGATRCEHRSRRRLLFCVDFVRFLVRHMNTNDSYHSTPADDVGSQKLYIDPFHKSAARRGRRCILCPRKLPVK